MDGKPKPDGHDEAEEQHEEVFARLEPIEEIEAYLVQQIAMCHTKLDQISQRLTNARGQLHNVLEELG